MRSLVACWRVLRIIVHLLHGLMVVALRFPSLSPAQQQARVQAWQSWQAAGSRRTERGESQLTTPSSAPYGQSQRHQACFTTSESRK